MMNHVRQSLTSYICNLIKAYKLYLSMFIVRALIFTFLEISLPYTIKLIIDKAAEFEGSRALFFDVIKPFIVIYILFFLVQLMNFRLLEWLKIRVYPALRQDILSKMFAYLNLQSFRYFQNNFAGNLVNKIIDMQGGVIEVINVINEVFTQLLSLIFAAIILFFIHPLFTVILISAVLILLAITWLFLTPLQNTTRLFAEARSSLIGKMVDSIANHANVQLFAREGHENSYIGKRIVHTVNKSKEMMREYLHLFLLISLIYLIFIGAMLFVLVKMYCLNQITIGDFSFITALSIKMLTGIWNLIGQAVPFSENIGKCKQSLSIMHAPHEVVDRDDAKPLNIQQGQIQFKDIYFHYDKRKALFENMNILIQPRKKTGLVGFSGSGKSSMINLILRLFEAQQGQILIDNQDIYHVTQESLRKHIALIPQDISLFHRSLMENIRYGNPNASDAEVIAASKLAHCHEFINQLELKYSSVVGERGIKLSTGQRQRIAIARAVLKNAPILILDEATSALDSITEQYIQDALSQLMQDKTCIVIAHRLSTLLHMDEIFVFDNGQIVENGTHNELMQNNSHYASMWRMQAGGFLPQQHVTLAHSKNTLPTNSDTIICQ